MRASSVAVCLALLSIGCSASVPASGVDAASDSSRRGRPCEGEPAIETCARGALWAECGGSAPEPVFACRRTDGRCYWFEGACVASGFEASPCPASDLCCLDAPPNGYPYDEPWRQSDIGSAQVFGAIYGWGVTPWDRERDMSLAVTLAPLEPASASVSCTRPELHPPCGGSSEDLYVSRTLAGAFTLRVSTTRGSLGGWVLWVEAVREDDGSLHARACRVPFTDGISYTCHTQGPDCATAGTLVLAGFPEDEATAATTRAHLTATFADGATIDAQL